MRDCLKHVASLLLLGAGLCSVEMAVAQANEIERRTACRRSSTRAGARSRTGAGGRRQLSPVVWRSGSVPMTSLPREPNRLLNPLISMNGSRSPLKRKKSSPKARRIPIRQWQKLSFIVPIESSLPGGRSRVCALPSPAVIRGRPPGLADCPCLFAWIEPSRSGGWNQSLRAARGVSLCLRLAGLGPPLNDPVCASSPAQPGGMPPTGGWWLRRFAGR